MCVCVCWIVDGGTWVRGFSASPYTTTRNTQDPKFRSIPLLKEAFQQRVVPYPPALEMLKKVGFRDDEEGHLVLKHRNRAVVISGDQVCIVRLCLCW